MKDANSKYAAYGAADPYFDLVRGALGDLVDGEHFFDIVNDHVVYEVLYDTPGWSRVIGRTDLMAEFIGYGDAIELQSADKLIVHKADDDRVVVIEYEVHGTILATGVKYDNRFCSVIKVENRKIGTGEITWILSRLGTHCRRHEHSSPPIRIAQTLQHASSGSDFTQGLRSTRAPWPRALGGCFNGIVFRRDCLKKISPNSRA